MLRNTVCEYVQSAVVDLVCMSSCEQLSRAVTQLKLDAELTRFPTFATMGSDFLGEAETPEQTMYMSEPTRVSDGSVAPENTQLSRADMQQHSEVSADAMRPTVVVRILLL